MSEQLTENHGPTLEPDAIQDLIDSGVKVARDGRFYIEWADES